MKRPFYFITETITHGLIISPRYGSLETATLAAAKYVDNGSVVPNSVNVDTEADRLDNLGHTPWKRQYGFGDNVFARVMKDETDWRTPLGVES